MDKRCSCGHQMELKLSTVVFKKNAEIENVPVLICDTCNHSEIFPPVKPCLVSLLGRLKALLPEKIHLRFDERNEIARIIQLQQKQEAGVEGVRRLIEERINELLDMLLLARSLEDQEWVDDIQQKLVQLTDKTLAAVIISFSRNRINR
ncbi:hypothetical protein [Gorillibacterium timonense]|uniref:hypothetical protein n=1 Tax=Gorillibacterium timonense TaxID=1689269 RepID=UPI00071C8D3E|nr:hypothetical protein [Gorillibacterium timonense]